MFWRYLHANGKVEDDLVNLLESPKLWHRLPRIVDTGQVNALLEEPGADDAMQLRDRAILEMFYACGLRVSELAGLKLGDVNVQVGFVRCIGKGRKERIVPVGGPASQALQEYIGTMRPRLARQKPVDRIFLSRTGNPLDRHNIYRLVQRYARRAGITAKMTPHSLRHCFASHLLAGGADLRIVQELLGHASVATTQIYTHVDRDRLKRIHQRFHPRG
jgi:integrase/recombinase XerD